jgi:hypothetical protein
MTNTGDRAGHLSRIPIFLERQLEAEAYSTPWFVVKGCGCERNSIS